METFEDFEDTFEDVADVTDNELANVAALAKLQLKLQKEVEAADAALKVAKARLHKVQAVDLPELLASIGLSTIGLATGEQIEITEDMYASISAKNKKPACAWLVEHGQEALVRRILTYSFGRGEAEKYSALVDVLKDANMLEFKTEENVNTGSVKSAIKEMLADGVDVPLDLFGVHFEKKAKITV